ncbi:MAG: 30S ribosome-binding factor RbfA [Bacilli bacterium]|nr:30S ribosome-binding factor RbfA [Bacilli bacterium]
MASHKVQRIASDISKNISDILMNEANDELLKTVTITGCEVTNDLSFCKVYFTSLSSLTKEEIEREMNEAAPFIRGKVSERVEIRHTPELRFIYDKSIEYGQKIEEIIKNLD